MNCLAIEKKIHDWNLNILNDNWDRDSPTPLWSVPEEQLQKADISDAPMQFESHRKSSVIHWRQKKQLER